MVKLVTNQLWFIAAIGEGFATGIVTDWWGDHGAGHRSTARSANAFFREVQSWLESGCCVAFFA
ncbi:hypothetical protein [Rhizobium sp. YS-1r]|uniref:hypothetical protein n=1 Tax=Rhizobium sp. YS-1r TaxID=1532558 RepID=UPI000B0A716F|nr:hypothetical protein [Rhizobium sp. YS-1r]